MKKTVLYLITLVSLPLQAANLTPVGRYASVQNEALMAQIHPLKAVQIVHFPATTTTIGQAVSHWLKHSGYHLATTEKQSPELKQVLKQPLPRVDRHLGPLSIEEGLRVLVGKNLFSLKQDDLLREVNFSLIKRRHA